MAPEPILRPLDDLPPVLRAWLHQLLSGEIIDLVERSTGQIEIRFYANNGAVRRNPMIILHGGPQPSDPT